MKQKHIWLHKSKYSDKKVSRIYGNKNLGYDKENECYKGISKTVDGQYIIIISYEKENKKDYAYIVTPEDALKEILDAGKTDLLKTKKFKDLVDVLHKAMDKN